MPASLGVGPRRHDAVQARACRATARATRAPGRFRAARRLEIHAAGEFVTDLDVGAGDALDPAEDEVLGVAIERREDFNEVIHLVEGELDIEGGFQPEGDLLRRVRQGLVMNTPFSPREKGWG